MKKLLLLGLIIIALVACSGSSRIIEASSFQISGIKDSLNKGYTVTDFKALKTKAFNNVYFVSARVTDSASLEKIGLWCTGDMVKTGGNLFMAVNQVAKGSTPFPYGPETKAQITSVTEGAKILLKYYE